jgi:electron transport complex protein RnfA
MEWIWIFLGTVLVNNYVLVKFLGLCPFMGVSKNPEAALGMGLATSFVLTLTSTLTYAIYHFILIPIGAVYLQTILFIITIATVVGVCELMMRSLTPILYQMLGIYLPLITSNCAVLGIALLNTRNASSLFESAWYGFSAAVGFTVVLILFSSIRERLVGADVPSPFRGVPIALITAGAMSVAFMGFGGLTG